MKTTLAFGWRDTEYKYSSGLDFLDLSMPIDRILDAWTPGITNATERARYYTIVPWIFYRYAKLGGEGSVSDQRRFVRALESFFAYANVAHSRESGKRITGIIRRLFAAPRWRQGLAELPLRGTTVPSTPSALDPALYGPSFSRLELVGTAATEGFVACYPSGQTLALAFDQVTLGLPGRRKLLCDAAVPRDVIAAWANVANLNAISSDERKLLRALFFAYEPFASSDTLNRVRSLLLLLWLGTSAENEFSVWDLELSLAAGRDLSGSTLEVPESLQKCASRWRVICLLKLLRHAAESAFKGLHEFVRMSNVLYPRVVSAARSLVSSYFESNEDASFARLVNQHRRTRTMPEWAPEAETAIARLRIALQLIAWCYAQMTSDEGQALLQDRVASWGSGSGASLTSYFDELKRLEKRPLREVAQWLLIDRGIARHNRVAAGKLWQHDTYRLVDDERGARAIGDCPLPAIQIRIAAMLSLLADLGLLERHDRKYTSGPQTASFVKRQLGRTWE
ncbi:MAG: hypothetical protein AB7O38_14615 [Pirellulaceae bacterium]